MLKLTKTGIGLLTKQYRSVLKKCLLLNLGLFLFSTSTYGSFDEVMTWGGVATYGWFDEVKHYDAYWATKPEGINTTFDCTSFGCGYYTNLANVVTTGPYTPTNARYGETIQIHKLMYASNHYNYSSADEALITINSTLKAVSNSLYNYYYTKDEVQAQVGKLNLTGVGEDSSYKNTVALGGNYIKPYVDVTLDGSSGKPTWAVAFNVKLTDGNSYAIGTWSGGTLPYQSIAEIDAWQPVDANDPNTKYYYAGLSGIGDASHPVTQADRDIIVAKARDLLKEGKLWHLTGYGVSNVARNNVSIIDNIGILDDVIGTWSNGTHIKEFDYLQTNTANQSSSAVMAYGTIGANLKALDTAIGSWSGGHYIKNSVSSSTPADTTHLTVGQALSALDEQLYNYYYTFRVDERDKVIDSASFFQKDFLTLQKVDLQSKNPTHLGAFTKCDEACPRPSERFASSSQEQMFKNDASVDAGTSRHCLRQFGDVLANLLKNMASKYAKMSDFMNMEVCHA